MVRATKFDPYHLQPLRILVRSLRPEFEILFRLEMCGVVHSPSDVSEYESLMNISLNALFL
jgi:hypothetical protein